MKDTKERIIQESARLFMQQTFDGTSVAEIGAAVGISPSSIFSHFKSKEEIYVDTVERYIINTQLSQKKFENYQNMSLREFIDLYLDKAKELMNLVQEYTQGGDQSYVQYFSFLLESTIKNDVSKEKLVALNEQEMEVWECVVKNAQGKGEVSSDISAQSIAELFCYSFAGMSYSLSINTGASIKQLEHMLNTVYRIVAK